MEKGIFQWPDPSSAQPMAISHRQLNWLLDGLTLEQTQAHGRVSAKIIV
ncbi:IS66 family insertion sequence element accessory protein TnpB [Bacillus thermotolerans]